MNLDDINKSILGLNTTFKSISESYKNMCSKMHILIDKDLLSYNTLLELEVSMNDLLINIKSVLFTIEHAKYEKRIEEEEILNQTNTNNLVDSTIINMMPLFFVCLMMLDKDSILHNTSFGTSQLRSIDLSLINPNNTDSNNTDSNDINSNDINSNNEDFINNINNNTYDKYNLPIIELD